MAQENVGININVQSNGEKALGSLKQQLREATAEVQALSEKFGATSQQAVEAAKRASELKDQIGDSKNLIDAFNPDTKFKAFSQTLGAVAGGFAAVQGALGLLGAEGEDVQKTLAKVQSALALSQGLEQLGDLGDAFKNLKTVAVDSFKAIKAAIGSSGIGLLVLALAAIVAYWDEIKAAVTGVSLEQKKLTEETNKNAKAQQEKLSAIDSQENILKLQGKSEREILGIKIKQTDEVIKATEQQIAQQKVVVKAQLEAEKRNKEILQGIIRFLFAPLSLILSTVDQVGKVLGKDFNLEEKFSGGIAGLVFDPVETEKKGKETLAALDKSLNDLKNKRAGYQLSIKAIDKQASEQASDRTKKDNEDRLAAEKNALQKLADLRNKLFLSTFKDENDRKRAELNLAFIKEKDEILANTKITEDLRNQLIIAARLQLNAELDAIAEAEKQKRQAADAQLLIDSAARMQKEDDDEFAALQAKNKKLFQENADFKEADGKLDKLSAEQKIALAQQTSDALLAVSAVIGKETAAGKALAVSAALINTYQGITAGVKLGFPAAIPAVALAAATGFSAVRNILAVKVPGAGSGSTGSLSSPNLNTAAPIAPNQPQAATTNISAQSINALGNQAIRTYVIESDVTSNQQRIAAIQQRARFG